MLWVAGGAAVGLFWALQQRGKPSLVMTAAAVGIGAYAGKFAGDLMEKKAIANASQKVALMATGAS